MVCWAGMPMMGAHDWHWAGSVRWIEAEKERVMVVVHAAVAALAVELVQE